MDQVKSQIKSSRGVILTTNAACFGSFRLSYGPGEVGLDNAACCFVVQLLHLLVLGLLVGVVGFASLVVKRTICLGVNATDNVASNLCAVGP